MIRRSRAAQHKKRRGPDSTKRHGAAIGRRRAARAHQALASLRRHVPFLPCAWFQNDSQNTSNERMAAFVGKYGYMEGQRQYAAGPQVPHPARTRAAPCRSLPLTAVPRRLPPKRHTAPPWSPPGPSRAQNGRPGRRAGSRMGPPRRRRCPCCCLAAPDPRCGGGLVVSRLLWQRAGAPRT